MRDLGQLESSQACRLRLVAADRAAHEAVIAEKMALASSEEEELKGIDALHAEKIAEVGTALESVADQFEDEEGRALYATLLEQHAAWTEKTRKVIEYSYIPAKLRFARKISNGGSAQENFEAMRQTLAALERRQQERIDLVNQGVSDKQSEVESVAAATMQKAARSTWVFIGIGAAASLCSILLAWLAGRSIVRALKRIIESLSQGATQIGEATSQVSGSSQHVAQGAGDQAASLEETSSALVEMAHQTRANAENAQKANESATKSPGQRR